MPQIKTSKKKASEAEPKDKGSTVVSAYSETGQARIRQAARSERTFRIWVIIILFVSLGVVIAFAILNGIYHWI